MVVHLRRILLASIACFALPCGSWAQDSATQRVLAPLEQLNAAVQQVIAKVSPAIVEIEVSSYRRKDDDDDTSEGEQRSNHILTKTHSLGSGVIIDSGGYIITNAHLVEGASSVRITLDEKARHVEQNVGGRTSLEGHVVGVFHEADLALIRVNASGLPTASFANSDKVRPGQLVFAIGNPEGLRNSASMGLISAVGRESEVGGPDYIQTDAAINAGSSGGALVDVNGDLVGITSFIVTEDGGSNGLGFALPSKFVYSVFQELKSKGRVEYGEIGIKVQNVTPALASGLGLDRDWGVIVSDVSPGSPAEKAGVKVQDILVAMDAIPLTGSAQFTGASYNKRVGDRVQFELLRGSRRLAIEVAVTHYENHSSKAPETAEIERGLIVRLDVVCAPLDQAGGHAPPLLRSSTGVIVVAKLANEDGNSELKSGDVIRSVNGTAVTSVEDLRSALDKLPSGAPAVLQIERQRQFKYISSEAN